MTQFDFFILFNFFTSECDGHKGMINQNVFFILNNTKQYLLIKQYLLVLNITKYSIFMPFTVMYTL